MANRFYFEGTLQPGELNIQGAEAHHITVVRRFQAGDSIVFFNGDGAEYPAQIFSAGKKSLSVQVLEQRFVNRELPFPVVVASALPKADRTDYLVEKLTELGVSDFVPLITERSIVIPKESKKEKLERMVIEASKQCGRNRLMQIHSALTWSAFLLKFQAYQHRAVLHTSDVPLSLSQWKLETGHSGILFAVGPEGGFAFEEIEQAEAVGFQIITAGPRILRIETACVAAATWAGLQ